MMARLSVEGHTLCHEHCTACRNVKASDSIETNKERLRRATGPDVITVDLVGALSGDRNLSADEETFVRSCKESRGKLFYSDLLYAVSHHYFAPELAERLWGKVRSHKEQVSSLLGRNIGIAVATLDYFHNIRGAFHNPTLMAESEVASLTNLSMRDGLTGLYNHSTFYELLNLELRNFRRYGVGLCLLLLDIDDFKQVNDESGHQVGDELLVRLAEILVRESRQTDICCRLGGDEFAILLRLTNDIEEARSMAERIARVAREASSGRAMSLSIGLVRCHHSIATAAELVRHADDALYRGKSAAKGCVVVDGEGA